MPIIAIGGSIPNLLISVVILNHVASQAVIPWLLVCQLAMLIIQELCGWLTFRDILS
jgi:hypothetical protein